MSGLRDAVNRLRFILGISSALVFVALLFVNTATSVVMEVIPSAGGKLVWTGALGITTFVLYQRWDARRRRASALTSTTLGQPGTQRLQKRRGAVVVLGLEKPDISSTVAELLRQGVALEWLTFVGTPQTLERKIVQEIKEVLLPLLGREFAATHLRSWEYAHAESLADSEQSVSEALDWLMEEGLAPSEIVVDVSHGRRPMFAGALLAAEVADVEVQYYAAEWDHITNQPMKNRPVFKVIKEHQPPTASGH